MSGVTPAGAGDVLDLIRRGEASTRSELQARTGLSRVTVGQRVDALLKASLVRESGTALSTGGRPALRLEFNPEHRIVLAASLNTTYARAGAALLDGRVIDREDIGLDIQEGPVAVLTRIAGMLDASVTRLGLTTGDVAGIGIALPGPVDPRTGRPNEPPIMAGWDGFDVAGMLEARFGVPVLVENDANAMAAGEFASRFPHETSLVLVKVSMGIGAGIVIDGRVYAGSDGGAGDIGHMRAREASTARCRCGAVGCLAASASGGALLRTLRGLGHEVRSVAEITTLAYGGEPDAQRLVHESGTQIGEVLAGVVSVVNPHILVIGGELASSELRSAVVTALVSRSLPRATRNLQIHLATLGEDAGLVGLTRLVVDRVFAASAVNRSLAEKPVTARRPSGSAPSPAGPDPAVPVRTHPPGLPRQEAPISASSTPPATTDAT